MGGTTCRSFLYTHHQWIEDTAGTDCKRGFVLKRTRILTKPVNYSKIKQSINTTKLCFIFLVLTLLFIRIFQHYLSDDKNTWTLIIVISKAVDGVRTRFNI